VKSLSLRCFSEEMFTGRLETIIPPKDEPANRNRTENSTADAWRNWSSRYILHSWFQTVTEERLRLLRSLIHTSLSIFIKNCRHTVREIYHVIRQVWSQCAMTPKWRNTKPTGIKLTTRSNIRPVDPIDPIDIDIFLLRLKNRKNWYFL